MYSTSNFFRIWPHYKEDAWYNIVLDKPTTALELSKLLALLIEDYVSVVFNVFDLALGSDIIAVTLPSDKLVEGFEIETIDWTKFPEKEQVVYREILDKCKTTG